MAARKTPIENRIMFGTANGRADKALISCRSERIPNAYECHILEIGGNYQIGNGRTINSDDILGERQILTFCKRSSLQAMIANLQELDKIWEDDIRKGYEWNIPENAECFTDEDRRILDTLMDKLSPSAQEAVRKVIKETKG